MKLFTLLMTVALWSSAGRADQPSVHGMLLFGNKVTYASHLPMFHAPHDYQVILKLSLSGGKALAGYEIIKKDSKSIFTLVPETMDLTKIISGEKTTFSALIYHGHFERGGTSMGGVLVKVEKVIFSSKLDAGHLPAPHEYLVFGEAGEYFAAHLIKGKPNFDAVAVVSQPYELIMKHCRTRECSGTTKVPLADSQLPVTLSSPLAKIPEAGEALGTLSGTVADIEKVIYAEEGDLAN